MCLSSLATLKKILSHSLQTKQQHTEVKCDLPKLSYTKDIYSYSLSDCNRDHLAKLTLVNRSSTALGTLAAPAGKSLCITTLYELNKFCLQ